MSGAPPKLAIVAGGGRLPATLGRSLPQRRAAYVLLTLKGFADLSALAGHPQHPIRLGAIGRVLELARREEAAEVVFAGHVRRPSLASSGRTATPPASWPDRRPDARRRRLMRHIVEAFETEGFGSSASPPC